MFRIGRCAVVYLQVTVREGEGACSDDRRTFTTYPGRLRACQSSPRLTRPGVISFASLSISWSHCAQIKERLQSRSRKRELKGLLSLSTSPVVPRFLTPLQTALASWVLSEATPVRAKLHPLHLSFYFILLKQLSEDGAGEKSWNGRGC